MGYFPNQIAAVISLESLAVSLGGTFAMTLMFTVSNAGIILKGGSSNSFDQIGALSPDDQSYLRDQARTAISVSFFALCSFLWLGVIVVAFLGNVKITKEGKGLDGEGARDFSENVVEGSFIGSLFRRRQSSLLETKNGQSNVSASNAEKGGSP